VAETQSPGEVVREVERGDTPRAPFLALSGVTIAIAVVAAVVIAGLLLIYYLV
jgi:hypothetical protein